MTWPTLPQHPGNRVQVAFICISYLRHQSHVFVFNLPASGVVRVTDFFSTIDGVFYVCTCSSINLLLTLCLCACKFSHTFMILGLYSACFQCLGIRGTKCLLRAFPDYIRLIFLKACKFLNSYYVYQIYMCVRVIFQIHI